MKHALTFLAALLLASAALHAAEPKPAAVNPNATGDLELSETVALPECHCTDWVRKNTQPPGVKTWDWKLTDDQWRQAVRQKGEGKREDTGFALWMPGGVEYAKGIVVISGHGSGEALFRHPELRKIARELHLALFKFIGNPMQRGFWPRSLLQERLKVFALKSGHPELEHAPLLLYGHSNGTGFSAIFPARESARVWAWISMRPGTTMQVMQPGAAQVPAMIMFGESDPFFAKPSQEKNMAVVESMRKEHAALWHFVVEPKMGHGPTEKSWQLVFSFLRHTWAARVPADADPRKGPVKLIPLRQEDGYLGSNWNLAKGGYQTLAIAPFTSFTGDKATASWLVDAAYAADWQQFQREGQLRPAVVPTKGRP